MSTAMAKESKPKDGKSVDDRSNRRTAPIQVEKELARMAAVIASHDGITQAELVSPVLRQFLRTHYDRVQKEIQSQIRQMNEDDKKKEQ